jgi:hypothetical protein
VLERLDPNPEYWEGKRGACVGAFQKIVAGKEPRDQLREIALMLRNTTNPQVEYIMRTFKVCMLTSAFCVAEISLHKQLEFGPFFYANILLSFLPIHSLPIKYIYKWAPHRPFLLSSTHVWTYMLCNGTRHFCVHAVLAREESSPPPNLCQHSCLFVCLRSQLQHQSLLFASLATEFLQLGPTSCSVTRWTQHIMLRACYPPYYMRGIPPLGRQCLSHFCDKH